MNKILSIIGKILLGFLAFLLLVFLAFWHDVYNTMDTNEKGIHRIFSSFKEAVYWAVVGIGWGGMFIYILISGSLGYNISDN